MMPVYRYMDSYPLQGNQISSAQNYYPSFKAVQPLAKFDPSKTVVINQPWLYPNSFNYSVPCYPCSSDGHFPGYYSHGFCPHSPAPQFLCCGHHHPFPGAFPVQYVPPPYYLKELPRYDYDKPRDNGYHCCGCPNHSHNQKNGGGERVEEQEPSVGNKIVHSLVPSQQEIYPYPVLWIPPEYIEKKEHKKPLGSDRVTQDKSVRDMKPPQDVKPNEQEPFQRHGWFPLDMKSLQSLLQGDDGRSTQDQHDDDKMRQFSFPIIWMPPNCKQREDEKEEQGKMNVSPIVKDPAPSNNVFPVKLLNDGPGLSKARDIHENVSDKVNSELKEKSTNQISIPVKQMEVFKEGENFEGAERRGRAISPKKRDHEMGKSPGASATRDSSSPPKSKLPPVCLRVDPLPRKKSSTMNSRSPSPPGSARKSQERTKKALKVQVTLDQQDSEVRESTLSSYRETEEKKSNGAAIQVVERKMDENKDEEQSNDSETSIPVCSSVDSSDQTVKQSEKNDVKSPTGGDKGLESADRSKIKQPNEKPETNDATIGDKRKLSVDEAALSIQSAYRGYQVRKWEPLKKLKQIAEVREQMIDLREKIHGLESSVDLQKDVKQTTVIGEMIMRLLLKLDTIQGLHPNLRDVRRSLARELVMLQEKLHLLAKARDAREHPTDDITHSVNAVSNNQDEGTSKPSFAVKDEQKETVNDVQLVAGDREFPLNESKEEVDGGVVDKESSMVLEQIEVADETTSQLPSEKSGAEEAFCAQQESICCGLDSKGQPEQSDPNETLLMDDYSQVPKLEGLQVVISKELVASAEDQMGTAIQEGRGNEIDSNISELSSSTKVDESDSAAQVVEKQNELPVGMIENEEPLQQEQSGFPENVPLFDGDLGEKASIDASEWQPTEDTSSELEEVFDLNEAMQQPTLELNEKPTGSCTFSVNPEVPNQDNSEKQCIEVFDEVTPVDGSMDQMKVESEDDNFPGETMLGGDVQQTQASESSSVVQTKESLQEETQQNSFLPSEKGESEMQKEVDQGIINIDMSSISEANNVIVSNVEEAGNEQDSVYQLTGIQEQREPHEVEMVNVSEKSAYHLDKPDNSKQEVLDRAESLMLTEHDEGKRESLTLSTATDELSTQEQEIGLENSKKLVEENEKMRDMVEKLVEQGKEQLAVISNLTGRLNDLEKKLRQKKMKTRRYRAAKSSPSHAPSAKPFPRKKAVASAV